jgi:hypothetical protein
VGNVQSPSSGNIGSNLVSLELKGFAVLYTGAVPIDRCHLGAPNSYPPNSSQGNPCAALSANEPPRLVGFKPLDEGDVHRRECISTTQLRRINTRSALIVHI